MPLRQDHRTFVIVTEKLGIKRPRANSSMNIALEDQYEFDGIAEDVKTYLNQQRMHIWLSQPEHTAFNVILRLVRA